MPIDPNTVISVVAPLQNQARILEAFIGELTAALKPAFAYYEIILVDDSSTDETATLARLLLPKLERVRYLRLSRSFGFEVAISAGLDSAIGDFVVVMDPMTDPPSMIPELIVQARRTGSILTGIVPGQTSRGWLSALGASLFRSYCRRYLNVILKPGTTHFRVLDRQVVNAVTQIRDRRRYLRIFIAAVGYNLQYFDYTPAQRSGKKTANNLFEELNTAIDIVVTSSRHPLRFVSRLGLFASAMNVLYIGYIGVVQLVKPHVAEGWTTTSLQNTAMFFFVTLILAVLCEYVGRLLEEVQGRPLYFVAEEKDSALRLEQQIEKNIVHASIAHD